MHSWIPHLAVLFPALLIAIATFSANDPSRVQ